MKNDTITKLLWRYATKSYDTSKKLTEEQVHMLRESLRLAASSGGIEPWKFIEVKNPELRGQISGVAYGQPQVTEASNLFILCAKTDMDEAYADKIIQRSSEVTGTPVEALAGYKGLVWNGILQSKTPAEREVFAENQVYIALGQLLAVAAMNDIDASPMGGFDRSALDELLDLKKLGLTSVVLCAVGYRSESDETSKKPKVRFDEKDVFIDL